MNPQIDAFIKQFHDCWTKGDLIKLTSLLHDQIIFVAPDLKTEIKGKERCLQTIEDYSNNAVTKKFEVENKKIHVWDHTAMVIMDYDIEYRMKNENYKEKGTEFWTMVRENEKWKLVWRALAKIENL